ncbi:SUF system NifU family Fe-S cluster assembly protein [Candidatus Peregrinibacteria bacterium]|jgi:nitrogen fixation protein NifU and related proteins|nr:SUF system NifU family Fe-S cluster assembly protein [Candidatus Peregrinibacteria bacterium]MBT7483681.1 SUF system NifU family Fe-S cluster assembly protein [Candidatus Peregrinibacteria bacterium]MBT7702740.1 SUF system NifU family Fe-S cluster assembly protein [Candidatus Peregrinibacteria bacterium]
MDIYQEQIIDLAKNPLNKREMKDATKTHSGVNVTCGDHVRIYLKLEEEKIVEASWEGEGCAISTASASLLTEELKGKTLDEVRTLKKEDLFEMLGIDKLGPGRVKCVTLSLETLRECVTD